MRRSISIWIISLCIFLVACQTDERTPIDVTMYNISNDAIGTATLSEQPDGVKVKLSLEGLEEGFHGIHVHEYPKCEAPDFKTAGNHFNPEGKEHGLMHPEGSHLGDLPNIEVDSDGIVEAELTLSGATLMDGKNSLLRQDGTSLIIHATKDDGISQPAGEAGERVACGKISLDEKNSNPPTDPTESNKEKEEK
ncbi:superoxide dismutase family protein [Aquibacillus kalidii]|uniref:superoxide dismutase family protein n=1 Tax=Aquibacillus kalidii TaxID=2762597 RepID=UPI0016467428|nr:superoxide dismutase family protein [Aquibacillus kalidii]